MKEQLTTLQDELNELNKKYQIQIELTNKNRAEFKVINSNDVQAIANALKSGKCPQGLIIEFAGKSCHLYDGRIITKIEVIALADALKSGKCPQGLIMDFSHIKINNENAKILADALKSGKCPQGLAINFNFKIDHISDKGVIILTDFLKSGECPSGLIINLRNDRATTKSIIALADNLKSGNCPKGLVIDFYNNNNDYNNISNRGILALADALKSRNCPEGLVINFGFNKIDKKCIRELADALKSENCPKGLVINLSGNNIDNEGAIALGLAIAKNTKLKKLDLRDNKFGEKAINSLLRGLTFNYNMNELKIDGLNTKQQEMLDSLLKRNNSQHHLGFAFFKLNLKSSEDVINIRQRP